MAARDQLEASLALCVCMKPGTWYTPPCLRNLRPLHKRVHIHGECSQTMHSMNYNHSHMYTCVHKLNEALVA